MSWEREDSLRRKVREAGERRAFKDSIETVLIAKEGQEGIRMQREAEQGQLRQDKAEPARQQQFGIGHQKNVSRIIRHVRDGRPERGQ